MRLFARALALLALSLGPAALLAARDAQAAWPPTPGADMRDPANWPDDYDAKWSYISYFPERTVQEPIEPADLKLGASGMSVDRAWTHTIGRDDVRIAVIDSGIQWENADLVNRAWLNPAELGGDHRPRDASGVVCGGAGTLAGYDCNGDGVFDVSDYRDDPRVAPAVAGDPCFTDAERTKTGGDRIQGDLNRNCILDAGDVIHLFSDGVDDDANGYTDDISGWDFYKNDNDPYDDTRFGHGTGEARDSNGEANNGQGEPGVCPGCRHISLRVGDSFIADANDFAKAVVYASDNGAKVVQEALGTLNQTRFSKAAIDYAYKKGAIVVASMADENSRHHNMPATANHVLTVHTIRYNEQKPGTSTTYVAFDTCSNYGGHLSLSISGTSCSSEAVGLAAGMAGLLYSVAADRGVTLSAEEAIQLFKMTADDVDVEKSRGQNPPYYWSQPGFDQRFGYGRANALRVLEAVETGRIPPEVDIVSPEWFEPVHADRAAGLISVSGRVAATRAPSYDYRVQWAPGVQPSDGDYKDLVAPLLNVPGATVSGGTTPLAQIDPRQIDTAHTPDPDSLLGENERTISIRVQAVAHYPSGDVRGEARRVISITNDKNGLDEDLLPGFPLNLGTSLEASTKLADIDGDGVREIVAPDSSGRLHVLSMKSGTPTELPGFPFVTKRIDGLNAELSSEPTVPSYLSAPAYKAGAQGGIDPDVARETLLGAPGVADLDGDGKSEIVLTTWPGTVYVVTGGGKDLPGWPKRLPLVPSCSLDPQRPSAVRCMDVKRGWARGIYGAPVLVDMDRDGRPEIVFGAFDGQLWVLKADGSTLDGFPVELTSTLSDRPARIMATTTAVDLNGDGIPELVSGSNQNIGAEGQSGPVFVVDGRGKNAPGGPFLPNWPITMASVKLFPVVSEGVVASQAVADFDGDGVAEIVIQGNGVRPLALAADPGPQPDIKIEPPNRVPEVVGANGVVNRGFDSPGNFGEKTKALSPDVMFPLFSQPSLGDIDQDGVPDVVISGGSLSLAGAIAGGGKRADGGQQLLTVFSGKTGKMLPGMPVVIEDYTFLVNHAVADLTGDGYPEVITGSGGYFLHAFDGCGREAEGFPKFTNGWIASTAAIGDVDGDGDGTRSLDVVVGTRTGWLFAWRTRAAADSLVEWESFHHDNANTGNYATPLSQGTRQRAKTPLTCDEPEEVREPRLEGGGGCVCTLSRTQGGSAAAGSLFAALALAGLGLRRARPGRRSVRRKNAEKARRHAERA